MTAGKHTPPTPEPQTPPEWVTAASVYLTEPVAHLFPRAALADADAPIFASILLERTALGYLHLFAPPPEPDEDGRVVCVECGRSIKARRDGRPVRHNSSEEPGSDPCTYGR